MSCPREGLTPQAREIEKAKQVPAANAGPAGPQPSRITARQEGSSVSKVLVTSPAEGTVLRTKEPTPSSPPTNHC
jgi:hypothetical protein